MHPDIDQITYELRRAYGRRRLSKRKVGLTIPERGGSRWWDERNPTYKGSKGIEYYLIEPRRNSDLSNAFEQIFIRYDAIPLLEEEGRKDLEKNAAQTTVLIETI